MKILSLGLDKSILDKNSPLAQRAVEYGELIEKYVIVVPCPKYQEEELSLKAKAYGSGGANKLTRFLKIYQLAKKILAREKFDLITVQDQYYLALIGWRLAKKFNLGLEIQVHGIEGHNFLRKLAAGFVIRRANAIRAVSQRMKWQLIGEFGVAEDKITVVPIYTEAQSVKLKAQNHSLNLKTNKNKFVFLTVGRLVTVKNISLQIEAMAEVIKKYPQIELWIAGDGPERKGLEVLSFKLQVSGSVKFLGWRDDLEEFYIPADVFLLTSNSEGWGLAVVEAASLNLPIIMTDVGLAGEIIKNNESGIIVPINNKGELIKAMVKLIEDEALSERLGTGAKKAILSLPNKEQTLELYMQSWQKAALKK